MSPQSKPDTKMEGGAQTLFFEEDEESLAPVVQKLTLKVYFYCEEDEVQERVFTEGWFNEMSQELVTEWNSDELPYFEVNTTILQ